MSDHVRAGWVVYFNGIEIPATSCSVSSGVWQIPQASISIPADKIMQRVGADDRVRVTIFAIDPYRSTNNPEEGDPFRLAFDGEIVAYQYRSTATGRSISFTAVDLIEALGRIFPHFIATLASIPKGAVGQDQAAASGVVNPFAPHHSLLRAGLTGDGDIKRPYDVVENVLRLLLDDTVMTNERSVIITEWFKPWNQRTQFSKRFVPSAYVETVAPTGEVPAFPIFRAAQYTEGTNALADAASRLGMTGSMYQVIQNIFQHVYYELAMLPNPPVLNVNQATREVIGGFKSDANEPASVEFQNTQRSDVSLEELQNELKQERARLTEISAAQRSNATEEINELFRQQAQLVASLQEDLENFKIQGGDYSAFQEPVVEADQALRDAREALKKQEAVVERDPTPGTKDALERQKQRVAQAEQAKEEAVTKTRFLTSNAQGSEKVLASYMTKPQTIFSVPPSFNVYWPSMYEQFTYDENFALQPTRTYIGDPHIYNLLNDGGQSAAKTALDKFALTVGYPLQANQRLVDRQTGAKINHHNFLIQFEEYFKGPVYNQITTPPWFGHLANRGSGPPNQEGSIQRIYARYEHERTRASRRNGGIAGPYNPNVVAGLPGVVIDNEESNNHVFCYFTSVQHQFGQESMSTSVSFTHAQTFGEFFQTLSDQYFEDGVTEITAETPSAVPQHPIRELRERFQVNNPAREYYQTMFWGDTGVTTPDPIIFDIFNVLSIRQPDGTVERIGFTETPEDAVQTDRSPQDIASDIEQAKKDLSTIVAAQRRQYSPGTRDAYDRKVEEFSELTAELEAAKKRDAAQLNRELRGSSGQPLLKGTPNIETAEPPTYVVNDSYQPLMNDSLKAFAYGSRPICTLDQYIDLQGARGVRDGVRSPSNKKEGKGAQYYVKIFNLSAVPVEPINLSADGLPCGPVGTDTRRNWEERLLAFRRKVYNSLQPFKA